MTLAKEFQDENRLIGKLYAEQRTRCECGSKTLELNYCFECGEIALSGCKLFTETKVIFTSNLEAENETFETKSYIYPVKNFKEAKQRINGIDGHTTSRSKNISRL